MITDVIPPKMWTSQMKFWNESSGNELCISTACRNLMRLEVILRSDTEDIQQMDHHPSDKQTYTSSGHYWPHEQSFPITETKNQFSWTKHITAYNSWTPCSTLSIGQLFFSTTSSTVCWDQSWSLSFPRLSAIGARGAFCCRSGIPPTCTCITL